ncbi:unnamed protein product [Urochloa humidicola]
MDLVAATAVALDLLDEMCKPASSPPSTPSCTCLMSYSCAEHLKSLAEDVVYELVAEEQLQQPAGDPAGGTRGHLNNSKT